MVQRNENFYKKDVILKNDLFYDIFLQDVFEMVYSFLDYGFDIDDHHFKLCEPSGIKPSDYF